MGRVAFSNGENYPDALSSINMTTFNNSAVILVGKNGNNGAREFVKDVDRGYIVGGEITSSQVNSIINETFTSSSNSSNGSSVISGGGGAVTPNPNPNSKPPKNTVRLDIVNAVNLDKVSDLNVDKNSDMTKVSISNGYKVLPNQKID